MLWFKNLIGNFGGYIAALAAIVAGVFAAWIGGRKVATAETKGENAEANAAKQIQQTRDEIAVESNTIKGTTDAKDEVNRLDSGAAADELREQWSRD